MPEILFEYRMNATTWVYVSSLLIIGIYFKFHRFWSVRNLDLIALMAFAPGFLLIAHHGHEPAGYLWLFVLGGFFLVRLLLDPVMVRRPLLEPNLSAGGLTFTCFALVLFLLANVITKPAVEGGHRTVERWEDAVYGPPSDNPNRAVQHGPGYPPFFALADLSNRPSTSPVAAAAEPSRQRLLGNVAARATAILGHLAILVGLVLIGYRHFGSARTGVAAASLYLLLPYTAEFTGRIDHVIPGALVHHPVCDRRRRKVVPPGAVAPIWIAFPRLRRGKAVLVASSGDDGRGEDIHPPIILRNVDVSVGDGDRRVDRTPEGLRMPKQRALRCVVRVQLAVVTPHVHDRRRE